MLQLITLIFVLLLCIRPFRVVPVGTVYIIDRKTHYLKTVKNGIFFFNIFTDKITTKISLARTTLYYFNHFETEDGKVCAVNFAVTYHAKNMEDVLYNLEKVRRSIDDILVGAMYYSVISLKYAVVYNKRLLYAEYLHNLQSQAMPLSISIDNMQIANIVASNYPTEFAFKPHNSQKSFVDPIQYN